MDFKDIVKLVLSLGVCQVAALIGTVFTVSSIPDWYAALNKPFFNPPDWLFAPAWTILYILMGLALYLIWRAPKVKHTNEALMLFGAQLTFNVIWSIVFFGFKSIMGGVLSIIILLLLILLTIFQFYKVDKNAAYLMMPYLLWVGFATILNVSILLMNP
jgi:tryptophan-rich sensory protein